MSEETKNGEDNIWGISGKIRISWRYHNNKDD